MRCLEVSLFVPVMNRVGKRPPRVAHRSAVVSLPSGVLR